MIETKRYYRVFWTKTGKNCAKILRIFGETPIAVIPPVLSGCLVTELANYCFAPASDLPETEFWVSDYLLQTYLGQTTIVEQRSFLNFEKDLEITSTIGTNSTITQLCGSYITHVSLPERLTTIGNYAFYNCQSLVSLGFGKCLDQIGSDAFMNCQNLHHLYLKCKSSEQTGLRRVLVQIPWDVEVAFIGNEMQSFQETPQIETVVFFPEYFETYDEIAPAHIFGRQITGEGFRARQCFVDFIIDFLQYDAIFPKLSAEESVQTACHFALCRLLYPDCLSKSAIKQYKTYIYSHGIKLCKWLVRNKQLDVLSALCQKQLLPQAAMQTALTTAVDIGWTEGSASILRWKQANSLSQTNRRYDFS